MNQIIATVGTSISVATEQSPVMMGIVLGDLMKMICTSPLSSMALTAMLGLTGLPMGIAAVACFGGSFTKNPIPIYGTNFFGGAISGFAGSLIFSKLGFGNKEVPS